MEGGDVAGEASAGEARRNAVEEMSDWELVSVYVNRGHGDDLAYKTELEAALRARALPVPEQMPPGGAPKLPASAPMARATFFEYVLLTYIVTGLFYSWLYLPLRLIKGDFAVDRKHKFIQTGVALAYQAMEVAAIYALSGEF
jgi:hypothetical protein